MDMKQNICGVAGAVILFAMTLAPSATGGDFSIIREPVASVSDYEANPPTLTGSDRAAYSGTVRVFMVEPESRWQDNWNKRYNYGFLDFALVTGVNIGDMSTWEQSIVWNAASAGYGDITENNIAAIAVVFNSTPHVQDAYPPNGFWFNAYYVDASALALPGLPGQNEVTVDFTHTVFIEEGTATW